MNKYLEFAKNMALDAGEIMKKYFYEDNKASYKGDNTIVTIADKEINDLLIERVRANFPGHSVDGEEKSFGQSDFVWVCDPVDGTAMYARHIPIAVFSLALVEKGDPIVAVVYDPWMNKMYTSIKGQGAYVNDERISVSDIGLGDKRAVGHYDMWGASGYNIYPAIEKLSKKCYEISIGSVIQACMKVASGDFVSVIFPGTEHKNCDIAAAKLIVEEAGGKVTNFFGDEQRYDKSIRGAIVTNKVIHDEVVKIIGEYINL